MYEYGTYFTGEIALHVAQIVNTEQLQHYYPRNMVCCRYIIVNNLESVMKIIILVIRKYYENYPGWDSLTMLPTITI
jgi:hypothetical protein